MAREYSYNIKRENTKLLKVFNIVLLCLFLLFGFILFCLLQSVKSQTSNYAITERCDFSQILQRCNNGKNCRTYIRLPFKQQVQFQRILQSRIC